MRRVGLSPMIRRSLLLLMILLSACTADKFENESNRQNVTVGFCAGGHATRTYICPDGLSTSWSPEDRLAVWARHSDGSFEFAGKSFSLYGADVARGFFTATLPGEMPADTYTYYACYPVPDAVDGTSVTFHLAASQDGLASGGADIMIADPQVHGALAPLPDPEDHSGMSMTIRHLLHQFRFYIPEGKDAMGEPVEKIVITFPGNVTGIVTADIANPSAAPVFIGNGSVVTMDLARTISESSASVKEYACASVFPCEFAPGSTMSVKLISDSKIGTVDPIQMGGIEFAAGHSTPVRLLVSNITDRFKLKFRLVGNNLGEKPIKITVAAPSGCHIGEDGPVSADYSTGAHIENGARFEYEYISEDQFRALSGQKLTVSFETDNCLLSQQITLPSLASVTNTTVDLTVPYLLYQDFSGVSSKSSSDDYSGGFNSGSKSGSAFLTGWNAARFGSQAGTSVRLACRRETSADYPARLDTAPLSGIKSGHSITVDVTFDYGMDRKEGGIGSIPKCNQYLYLGKTTKSGTISSGGSVYSANVVDWITGGAVDLSSIDGTFDQHVTVTQDSPVGSYTNLPHSHNFQMSEMGPTSRVTWLTVPTHAAGTTNGTYWLYIDNIKITVAN